jgi:multidrug efflux pump subunit AcrB
MTLTLVAVYAPLAFTPGRTGRLFIEFALALAGAVVVSGFVALTLSPMMCSLLLRHNPKPGWFDRTMERSGSPRCRTPTARCCAGSSPRWYASVRRARDAAAWGAASCRRAGSWSA